MTGQGGRHSGAGWFMSPDRNDMVPLRRAPPHAATTWGPYYDALHPPGWAHFIVDWKVVPTLMESAERLWRHRQELRNAYEATHGTDPRCGRHSTLALSCMGLRLA